MWKTFAIDIGSFSTNALEPVGSLRVSHDGNIYKLAKVTTPSGSGYNKPLVVAWTSDTEVSPTAGSTASPKGVLVANIPESTVAYTWILINGITQVTADASYTSPAVGDEVVATADGKVKKRTTEDANAVVGVVVSTSPLKIFIK
jgi:hypothetical protein